MQNNDFLILINFKVKTSSSEIFLNLSNTSRKLQNTFMLIIDNNSGVMVIVVGNGHGDTSSNPERDWSHFT